MSLTTITPLTQDQFPPLLHEIPDPPEALWCQGTLPPPSLRLLAVVGSRQYTSYGKQVVEHIIKGLQGYPIGIISGLALGIDGLAHEAALRHGMYTMAVPGSALDENVLYPARHRSLARRIVESGGCLLSEFSPGTAAAPWTFPQRNRIMAGMCHATLLIEAGERSGTLITARLAVDYNRELLAVPGSIFSKNSFGTHQFLKLGATLVSEVSDILGVFGIEVESATGGATPRPSLTPIEQTIISHLTEPRDRDTLIRLLNLDITTATVTLMQMELQGYIHYDNQYYSSRIP